MKQEAKLNLFSLTMSDEFIQVSGKLLILIGQDPTGMTELQVLKLAPSKSLDVVSFSFEI